MFHRQDMHAMLLEVATSPEGEGEPCTVVVDHIAKSLDYVNGTVTFENGETITADLIIGADGIRVSLRTSLRRCECSSSLTFLVRSPRPDWGHSPDSFGQPNLLPLQRPPFRH